MIFADVRAVLESLSGQLTQLATALRQLSDDARQGNNLTAGVDLTSLALAATGQSGGMATHATEVDAQSGLLAALQFGVTKLVTERGMLRNLRASFDIVVQSLPPSGDRTFCERLLAATEDFVEAKIQEFAEAGSFPVGPSYNVGRLRSTV